MNNRKTIEIEIQRRLYAESMGKCMNPDCEIDLFLNGGDIMEKAHIDSYHNSKDNSFENLVILCPNCHTNFDKNKAFTEQKVKEWKRKRKEEMDLIFSKKYSSFEMLEEVIKPILEENKTIFKNYYLKDNSTLWKKFEEKVLINNQKLKLLLIKNKHLLQRNSQDEYSNLAIVDKLILHIDEFYSTRNDGEKIRQVLFPEEVNSIFGVEKIDDSLFPATESLECLIKKLQDDESFVEISLDTDTPYIKFTKDNEIETLSLKDIPRLRQEYYKCGCFRKVGLRLESLVYTLKWLKKSDIEYEFQNLPSLSEIKIKGKLFKFVYEYCLSKETVMSLSPKKGSVIFNLFNFGGDCISKEAYKQAENMEIKLLSSKDFYKYINKS